MIGPMGMLLAGMAIAEVPLKKVFYTPRNYLPVFLRLLGVPLVIVLLLWAVHASLWIPEASPILMTVLPFCHYPRWYNSHLHGTAL